MLDDYEPLDIVLQVTTLEDVKYEEYEDVQMQLREILDTHGIIKCTGLTKLIMCTNCKRFFKDIWHGQRLAIKLAALNEEYYQAICKSEGGDDGFDPRDFAVS